MGRGDAGGETGGHGLSDTRGEDGRKTQEKSAEVDLGLEPRASPTSFDLHSQIPSAASAMDPFANSPDASRIAPLTPSGEVTLDFDSLDLVTPGLPSVPILQRAREGVRGAGEQEVGRSGAGGVRDRGVVDGLDGGMEAGAQLSSSSLLYELVDVFATEVLDIWTSNESEEERAGRLQRLGADCNVCVLRRAFSTSATVSFPDVQFQSQDDERFRPCLRLARPA